MGGWIRVEKDLLTDARFMRLAAWFHSDQHEPDPDHVTHERYSCNACAYRVLGMLCGMWLYADTHIAADDTLAMEPCELDSLIGWEGFAEAVMRCSREEWLAPGADGGRIKLPGYQEHNGMEAKKRALTATRVQRYRKRQQSANPDPSNAPALHLVQTDGSNACALPDHTKPDHTKSTNARAFVMRNLDAAMHDACQLIGLNREAFELWTTYRRKIGKALKAASLMAAAKQLAALGTEGQQLSAVNRSIAAGYTGLFAERESGNALRSAAPSARPPRPTQESALAALAAAVRQSEAEPMLDLSDEGLIVMNDE